MVMRLRFTKMHGIGNDFVVMDGINQAVDLTVEQVRQLSDRHVGIGCDQLLVVGVPQHPDNDFRYRIYNADGTEVENCGNGARCFAIFVRDKKLTGKRTINVETSGGILSLRIGKNNEVTVNMGVPILAPDKIPFRADTQAVSYSLDLADQTLDISAVSMGNPHAVTMVNDVTSAPVEQLGPLIVAHPLFPQQVNAGFMSIRSRNQIDVRVYERGVGETLACGSGACAAMVAARLRHLVDAQAVVSLPGGNLSIEWQGTGYPVFMTGPATNVFHGKITI